MKSNDPKSPGYVETEVALTPSQRGKIDAVIYTLNHGLIKGWNSPKASLQACIDVLTEALNGTK